MKTNIKPDNYPKWITQGIAMMLFLFAIYSSSFAQSSYGVIQPWGATHTVCRAWSKYPDIRVEYSSGGSTNGFYLRDNTNNPIVFVPFNDVIVTDFEILNDTVFFCGYNLNGGYVGSFDINLYFSGAGPISFALLENINGTALFDHATKIDVYEGKWGTEMAVIGDISNSYGIADVFWTSSWHMLYYYIEPSGVEVFEDVAVTDHYVVAVENKGYPHGSHYMRIFNRSNYWTNSFLTSPLGEQIHFIHTSNYSRNLVTHLCGDTFAIAVMRLEQNNIYGNCLLLYDGTTYLGSTFMQLANFYDTRWKLYDFRYNKLDRGLYLLEDTYNIMTGDTVSSLLFRYNYPYYSGSAKGYYTSNTEYWKSFDCNDLGNKFGSGVSVSNELLDLNWMVPQEEPCLRVVDYAHTSVAYIPDSFYNHPNINNVNISNIHQKNPDLLNADYQIICK